MTTELEATCLAWPTEGDESARARVDDTTTKNGPGDVDLCSDPVAFFNSSTLLHDPLIPPRALVPRESWGCCFFDMLVVVHVEEDGSAFTSTGDLVFV